VEKRFDYVGFVSVSAEDRSVLVASKTEVIRGICEWRSLSKISSRSHETSEKTRSWFM